MSTVIITGAAGFLGSHLSLHHLKRGDRVIGIDDFSSSSKDSVHFRSLCGNKNFSFISFNIADSSFKLWKNVIDELYDTKNVDIVYNFACPASPPIYQSKPVHTLLTCTAGTNNVLELAMKFGSKVVHASTSEVYGDPDRTPQNEDYHGNVNSYGPRSCYDEGKRAAEALCYDYLNTHDLDVRLVRIFNTYGPHMDPNDGRVVSNFVCQALRGENLTIYGDGNQGRSFCYVDDLIRGITALGELPNNPRTPINLGNPNEFTIKQLAQLVLYKVQAAGGDVSRLNITPFVTMQPAPKDDPTQRCPDITFAKHLLGWEPKVMLSDGLNATIDYFRSVL